MTSSVILWPPQNDRELLGNRGHILVSPGCCILREHPCCSKTYERIPYRACLWQRRLVRACLPMLRGRSLIFFSSVGTIELFF